VAVVKIYRLVLTAVAFCLLCVSVVTLSMGWLTNLGEIKPPISFTAGNAQSYSLSQITYNNEDANPDPGKQNIDNTIENIGLGAFDVNDLQFGTINNLYFLENENYVFYAVAIPKEMGGTVDLGIAYNEEDGGHFTIYSTDKNTTSETYGQLIPYTKENLDDIKEIESEDTFISYSFALSASAPETYTTFASMDALFTDEPAALNVLDANGVPATSRKSFDTTVTGDYYYLYIKLEPNIELYKFFIDYLWADMPFYLVYDVRVVLSVSPASN
jgi:hypothetical protein